MAELRDQMVEAMRGVQDDWCPNIENTSEMLDAALEQVDYEAAAEIIALHSFDRSWDDLAPDTKASLLASAYEIVDAALPAKGTS